VVAQKVVVENAPPHEVSLHEAAAMLDVHYMTAYRYVRLGLLPAHKAAGTWRVLLHDLREFQGQSPQPIDAELSLKKNVVWWERLEARLLAGDGNGAWAVVEAAAPKTFTPECCSTHELRLRQRPVLPCGRHRGTTQPLRRECLSCS
jgi:hypothetical protein